MAIDQTFSGIVVLHPFIDGSNAIRADHFVMKLTRFSSRFTVSPVRQFLANTPLHSFYAIVGEFKFDTQNAPTTA